MDSGYLEPEETLEDEYDVLQSLLPEEILGIVDHMLCYEVRPSPNILERSEANLMLIQVW